MITATPEQVGFSPARLQRIKPVMQGYVDQGKLAGLLTLIARRGEVVHAECYGRRDVEGNKPLQFDTIFRIYSMTKPLTSVAAMMLWEEGHFQLGDPIARFMPEFKEMKVFLRATETGLELADAQRPITIRDLLTHTSGLSYGFDEHPAVKALYCQMYIEVQHLSPEARSEEAFLRPLQMPLAALASRLARLPLVHQPGSAWHYGLSVDLLGYLVEVVSGMTLAAFMEQRIFQPLGMVDSGFYVPPDRLDRFAALYAPNAQGALQLLDAPSASFYGRLPAYPWGGGGLVSTAADYLRFAQMLLNKGEWQGARLLGRKTVEWMSMNHLPPHLIPIQGNPGYGFGLGFRALVNVAQAENVGSEGTFGWDGAASTDFWVDPQEELIGLLMTQLFANPYPFQRQFRVLTYQALED